MVIIRNKKQDKDEITGKGPGMSEEGKAALHGSDDPSDGGESLESLKIRLKEKEEEAAENFDRYLRTAAELENFRKRAAREKLDAIKYGNEQLLRDLLPLMDAMDRALQQSEKSCDFEAFRKGLELIRTQFTSCLGRHGVEAIDCLHKPFDPNLHEALMQVERTGHEDKEIVDELEKGYLLSGRLLRPSKVSVCKRVRSDNTCEDETAGNGG